MPKLELFESIISLPYSEQVKTAILCVWQSGYFLPKSNELNDIINEFEDFVIINGVFIGGRSMVGDFIVYDIDDFIYSYWVNLIGDGEPHKSFCKKVFQLYKSCEQTITNG